MNRTLQLMLSSAVLLIALPSCSSVRPSAEAQYKPLPLVPPSVTMPEPPGTYMKRVEENIERWDSELKDAQRRLTPSKGSSTK